MKSLLQGQANRRQLLVGGACVITASLAAARTMAAEEDAIVGGASVVLHDARFPLATGLQQRLQLNGARIISLTDDPVRLWRDQLAALLQRRDTRLLGMTRWPEFLLLRGLAAESRRHVRYERVDATTGAITWLIA